MTRRGRERTRRGAATRRALAALGLTIALATAGSTPSPVRAQEAPADSTLHRFLGSLSDSTDRYFGLVAAPPDTTGLDSALAVGLASPWRGPGRRLRFSYGPVYAFNRVDGTLAGASVALARRAGPLRLAGDLGRAVGSRRWLGGGEFSIGTRRGNDFWRLRARAGRRTAVMDRDQEERRLATLRALVWGTDRQDYLRRDGSSVALAGEGAAWHAGLQYRDMLESPLAVTTRWNLAHDALAAPVNLGAAFGRAHEISLTAGARWPGLPFWSEVAHAAAGRALGGDFDYRRTRVALGGELPLAGRVSFLPEFAYGRLGGDAVPQASFYLGGPRTLRSLPVDALGGTGFAIARLEAISADDLLALLHLPHPAMFPIQGGLFVATAAVWGPDPRGGPGTPAGAWPKQEAWLSEAGASLLYRPGLGGGGDYFRLDYAHPLGSTTAGARWSVSYSRALALLRPL